MGAILAFDKSFYAGQRNAAVTFGVHDAGF
jgi:hypothetical protein